MSRSPVDKASALHRRARALEHDGQLTAAVTVYRQALELAPADPRIGGHLAMALHDAGQLSEALAAYEQALSAGSNDPTVGHNYGYALHEAGRTEEAITAYERVLASYPDSPGLRRDLAQAYEATGRLPDAVGLFEQALSRQPDDLEAHRQLTRLCLRAVPRWHFPMLNNAARNNAYDQAIRRLVRPGDLVLDIGTGSGLLAMMAARAGAEHVVSCEIVSPIAQVAQQIIAANDLSDCITVVNKASTRLHVGGDLVRPADVLISEVVDVALMGENMLATVDHARTHLLAAGGRMAPQRAIISAILVESAALVALERVSSAAGFDVSGFNRYAVPGYLPRRLAGHEHRRLTTAATVFAFDFRTDRFNPSDRRTREIALEVSDGGVAHAVVFWFQLWLDGETVLDSAPGRAQSHWVQAVQLMPPRELAAGDIARLRAHHDRLHIAFAWE